MIPGAPAPKGRYRPGSGGRVRCAGGRPRGDHRRRRALRFRWRGGARWRALPAALLAPDLRRPRAVARGDGACSPSGAAPPDALRVAALPENRAALAHRPELHRFMVAEGKTSRLLVETDESGLLNLKRRRGPWFHGPTAARSREVCAADPKLQRARLVVLFGLGLGHELEAIHALKRAYRIIVIEPQPEVFEAALGSVDISALLSDDRTTFLVGLDLPQLKKALQKCFFDLRALALVESSALAHTPTAPGWYGAALDGWVQAVVEVAASAQFNLGNDPEDALIGFENTIHNISWVEAAAPSVALRGWLKGRAAVVASAGPSLEAALPALAARQHELTIICPDTSLKILRGAGIRPDLVATRERKPNTASFFNDVETSDTHLAFVPPTHPLVLERHRGGLVRLFRPADLAPFFGADEEVERWVGSSGNMAFGLAAYAGAETVVLVGQDFTFGPSGQTHADGGATSSRQKSYYREEKFEVPGAWGGTVQTTARWLAYLRDYAAQVAGVGASARVLNTSPFGARIEGTQAVSLEEALAACPSRPKPPLPLGTGAPQARLVGARPRFIMAVDGVRVVRARAKKGRQMTAWLRRLSAAGSREPSLSGLPELVRVVQAPATAELEQLRSSVLEVETGQRPLVSILAQSLVVRTQIRLFALEHAAASQSELESAYLEAVEAFFGALEDVCARAETRLESALQTHTPMGSEVVPRAVM